MSVIYSVETFSFIYIVSVTITILCPIVFSASSVDEVAKTGTTIGLFSAKDEDESQSLFFTLVNDAGGLFKVGGDGVTLLKATDERLNILQVYNVKVKVTDNGTPAAAVGI